MDTLNACLGVAVVLLMGVLLLNLALSAVRHRLGRRVDIYAMFHEIRPKMWMTAGLGSVFLFLYLSIVLMGSYFNDSQFRIHLFMIMYEHPTMFVYLGLLIFASFSTAVYLVRVIIKALYNNRT
jgi:hypothetical protein